jgi:nitrite reductase (NO-forming)
MLRVRAGDEVEFHLNNHPSSKMPHNIDLHAVTGPGGGAARRSRRRGTVRSSRSRHSIRASTSIIAPPRPWACTSPTGCTASFSLSRRKGCRQVDREFYVLQSEFYTTGRHGETGLQPFDMQKAIHEDPEYVVFNGSVGALVGDNALKAKVGENVRMFVGNGGPNLVSSFHVIGEIFDNVHTEGGTLANQRNVQTTLVPAGGSAIVDMKLDVPGTFISSITRSSAPSTRARSACSRSKARENKTIYSGKQNDVVYLPEGGGIQSIAPDTAMSVERELPRGQLLARGAQVFAANCAACHQLAGQGIAGAFPPLAASDYLMANKERAIGIVLNGLNGAVTVNGASYNGVMPAVQLSNTDVAAVLSYVRTSFGNKATDLVTLDDVKKVRAASAAKH